jgi:hypothetical protein
MARPSVLTEPVERELAQLLDVGIRQRVAANALGISTRTVQRFTARRRAAEAETLEQLLDRMPTLDEVLAENDRPPRRRRRRAPKRDWQEAARVLEEEYPERWG